MAGIPAEVRINTNTPFPTMVTGANGIGLGKNNGIWTVQLNINSLATSSPPSTAFATDYVPVFDSTTGLYSKVALNVIAAGGTAAAGGSNGQIQYNNAGAFGGFTATGDATINVSTGVVTIPVFGASGGSHTKGEVPDPGAVAGTARFLREDATWGVPPFADNAAWTAYTPTITAGSGTFTTVSASGRYKLIGKTAFVSIVVGITTVGTAVGSLSVSLPVTATSSSANMGMGRENGLTGKMVQGLIAGGATSVAIFDYQNVTVNASGAQVFFSAVYETV